VRQDENAGAAERVREACEAVRSPR
jgi:hypothetical protein